MKKFFIALCAAVCVFTSCSKDSQCFEEPVTTSNTEVTTRSGNDFFSLARTQKLQDCDNVGVGYLDLYMTGMWISAGNLTIDGEINYDLMHLEFNDETGDVVEAYKLCKIYAMLDTSDEPILLGETSACSGCCWFPDGIKLNGASKFYIVFVDKDDPTEIVYCKSWDLPILPEFSDVYTDGVNTFNIKTYGTTWVNRDENTYVEFYCGVAGWDVDEPNVLKAHYARNGSHTNCNVTIADGNITFTDRDNGEIIAVWSKYVEPVSTGIHQVTL